MSASIQVPAGEVADFLARHRPPTYRSIKLSVPPHRTTGSAAHETVVGAVLIEQLTAWPRGTTLVISYGRAGYAQSLAYPPTFLTEIGPLSPAQLTLAVEHGWIDPKAVPKHQPDFDSRPVWKDNPVREWCHPPDALPEVAAFLSESVRTVLGFDPAAGYTLSLFNNRHDEDELSELAASASLTIEAPLSLHLVAAATLAPAGGLRPTA